MDPIKVAIFIAFFGLFLLLVRRIFAHQDPRDFPGPPPVSNFSKPLPLEDLPEAKQGPVATGAELPFPINLPPVEEHEDGSYNRPNVLNYYFKKIDLVTGPSDPASFCDQFFVQFQSPDQQSIWTNEYIVATPAGLQAMLESRHQESALIDHVAVIVRRWSLGEILQAIMEDMMEKNETSNSEPGTN